jgi:predicted peroxiredoxin
MKAALLTSSVCMLLSLMVLDARGQSDPAPTPPQEGVFVHVSHGADDPHRLLMAFKMAVTMAESGRGVLVYCDIEAVNLLTKDAVDLAMEPFPPSGTLLARMLELGVRVRACPTCMKVAGIEASDLRVGVKTADREEFFGFVPGRILSLDY